MYLSLLFSRQNIRTSCSYRIIFGEKQPEKFFEKFSRVKHAFEANFNPKS